MTDNELLLAISNMMDSKMDPVNRNIQKIETEIEGIKGEVKGLKDEVKDVKREVSDVKREVGDVKREVSDIKREISDIKNRVKKIELTQENEILPRLNTIEACYTSTYNRYKESVETYDLMKQDITVLKRVVAEHSEKLQKLA